MTQIKPMVKLLLPENNNRKINGKSVYILYLQLKGHFNGRGDVIKNKWMMRVSDAAYEKRKDKYFFEKLSNTYTLRELCLIFISNLVANQDAWIGEISDADAIIFYREYQGKLLQVKDRFSDDVKNIYYFAKKMNKPLGEIFVYNDQQQSSYIFKLLQSNIISFETFIMLDSFLDIIDKHDKFSSIIWEPYSKKLNAYRKILQVDNEQAKALFKEVIIASKY